MGTNYYVATKHCESCNRYDEEYHIGKSSWGWAFSFQGYKPERLISWQAWKTFLKDKIIMDEYGDRHDYDDFVEMIEGVKSPNFTYPDGHKNLQHNTQGKIDSRPWFNPEYDWDDPEGYAFCSREFS
jgi:hypothetical protein